MTASKKNKTAAKKSTKSATKPGRSKTRAPKTTTVEVAADAQKLNEMPTALVHACNNIRDLMKKANTGDSAARYLVAAEVQGVMTDKKKYGKGSVRRIAQELGCTSVLLYNYAHVAEVWTAKMFAKLASRLTVKKVPLTFWQFVVIAKEQNKAKRAALLDEAFQGASSRKMEKAKAAAAKTAGEKTEIAGFSFEQRVACVSALLSRSETEGASHAHLGELEAAATDVAAMKTKLEELQVKATARITEMRAALAAPRSSEQVTDTKEETRSDLAAE